MPCRPRRLRRGGSGHRHPAGHPCARVRRTRGRQLPDRQWRGHRGSGRTRGAGRALSGGPGRSDSRHPASAIDDGRCHGRHPVFARRSGRRVPGGVLARGVAGRRRDPRLGSARALLRGRHALAARNRGRRRYRPRDDPGAADGRRPALRLAGTHARFGAALPASRVHPPAHRLDGAAQAQRTALAPDGRPGLAARDPPLPRTDARRRLAQAGRGRRSAALRRLLHAGRGARTRRLCGRTLRHDRPGDRDARPCAGRDRERPEARDWRRPAARLARLGRARLSLQRRRVDIRVSRERPRRSHRAVSRRLSSTSAATKR